MLNDFAMNITSLVKADQHTRYMAEVKREHYGSIRCGIHWIMTYAVMNYTELRVTLSFNHLL